MGNEQTESVNNTLLMPRGSIKTTIVESTRPEDRVQWLTLEELSAQTGMSPDAIERQFDRAPWVKHWRLADEIYPSPFVPMPSIPRETLDYIEAVEKHAQALSGSSQTEQD